MIAGSMNAYRREATIRVTVLGSQGQSQEIEAIIDTGFTGSLTLPLSVIMTLGLVWISHGRVTLAGGSERLVNFYEATVLWDGTPRRVMVEALDDDSLVGMTLLDGYELTIQAADGGRVTITALP
ncbi:MAG: clan AA aspartic protease [Deltaproteobacteria bacterium]|nr:clan AA aspartic protease [Deltaproteobacteria bacterium]